MLRFDRLKLHRVGPFEDVDIDLAALPALVAVTGPNGAGKSTLLEVLTGGAIYRACETRGPLSGLARARDSWVEVDVVNGQPWRIRQSIDAVSGKGEAFVADGSGRPAFADTKVKSFDAWARAHLPVPEVLYSSTVAAQGSAGFLALKPADRKAVLLRVLGVERLEQMAARARERLAEARGRHATASALADAVVGASLSDAEAALAAAILVRDDAQFCAEVARTALDEAQAKAASACEARRAIEQRQAERARIERQVADALRAIEDAEKRIANNRALVAERERIEDAVVSAAAHAHALAALAPRIEAAREAIARSEREQAERGREMARVNTALAGLDAREREARAKAARRSAVDAAIAALPEARATAERAGAAVATAKAALEELMSQSIAGAEQRIVGLRDGLVAVCGTSDDRDGSIEARAFARGAIEADDEAVVAAAEMPSERERARNALRTDEALAAGAAAEVRDLESTAAFLSHVELAEEALAAIAAERADLTARKVAIGEAIAAVVDALATARLEVDRLRAEGDEHGRAKAEAERYSVNAPRLSQAVARIEELEAAIVGHRTTLASLDEALASIGPCGELPAVPDVTGAEREVRVATEAHARAASRVALAERDVEDARGREARRAELEAERDRIGQEIADWKRIADDLGRDGLQAMEIDAAGPELSALANDLLHTCVGPRWTVTIDTQRLGADGRLLESLEVRVLDTVAGREAPVETFSGGERVLLGEAVSLALAMLACRRSGQRDVTIVRDESGAALDGERARAYVAMLRRALVLTGARQVLLVTHSPDVAELADARLHVDGGAVEVRA